VRRLPINLALNYYASFKATEPGIAKFLCDVINKVWYNDLKDANTFYTKATALDIITLLNANSRDLHVLDMIALCTNKSKYYMQVDGIPQFIVMMEDTQKKAKGAGMPIANVELLMMALAVVLVAQQFPCKVDDWESLLATKCTWSA
jgi:hypothetical protein